MKIWNSNELDDLYDNYQYYIKNKLEAESVFGRTWIAIKRRALKLGLNSDSYYRSNLSICGNIKSYIDGLLLSDGNIDNRVASSYYRQVCKYDEWLLNIKEVFDVNGIESIIKLRFSKNNYIVGGCFQFHLSTLFYKEFNSMRNRWYKEWYDDPSDETNISYKKMVPEDIKLTPDCVSNWYLGDGSCTNYRGSNYDVRFATCGFVHDDSVFLSNLFNETLDIHSYVDYEDRIHLTRRNDIISFFDYIKLCSIPSCYSKKFPKELII